MDETQAKSVMRGIEEQLRDPHPIRPRTPEWNERIPQEQIAVARAQRASRRRIGFEKFLGAVAVGLLAGYMLIAGAPLWAVTAVFALGCCVCTLIGFAKE